jgi:DNA repair protein RecO (recombination protein O)
VAIMPIHETDAFVLRTYALKETDKIGVFFGREGGKVRGVAHGARKLRSRFGASLEPFTEVAISYFQAENRELVSVSSCEIIRSQFDLITSGEMLALFDHFVELVDGFMPEHESNERVYRLIAATLQALHKATPKQCPALVRYFEIWMLKLAGFFPDLRFCGLCHREPGQDETVRISEDGAMRCSQCNDRTGGELRTDSRRLIHAIIEQGPAQFISSPREPRVLGEVGSLTTRLIERTLERPLRSYEFFSRLQPVS